MMDDIAATGAMSCRMMFRLKDVRSSMVFRLFSILVLMSGLAHAQEGRDFARGWTEKERRQIYQYYLPIKDLTNSSHWHHWDCCQSNRCFPARPGSVRWTPDGIAITHPDGGVLLYSESDPIWKPKQGAGLNDPRYHVCFERQGADWIVVCAYSAQVMG
jgi:hypothetical protein